MSLFKKIKANRAFTIPELLVIIAVISILTIIVWVMVSGTGNAQARDAKRVSEVDTLRTALKLYHMDHGKYPEQEGTWCSIETDCTTLVQELLDGGYLTEIPEDPLFGKEKEEVDQLFSYQYMSTSSGEGYRIYIDLETRESYEVYAGPGSKLTYVYGVDGGGDPGGGSGEIGSIDVLSAGYSSNDIRWSKNDGAGNFEPATIIDPTIVGPKCVYTVDIDKDGDIDVLAAGRISDEVRLYKNDGTGNFEPYDLIDGDCNGARSIYSADLNEDGYLDILSTCFDGDSIRWYENDGLGGFLGFQNIDTVDTPNLVRAADINNDLHIDVLISTSGAAPKIAWYQNNGLGGFSPAQTIDSFSGSANGIHAADLDGDTDLDIIVAVGSSANKIRWYENDGSGTFNNSYDVHTGLDNPWFVYAADLDGDTHLDILATILSGGDVYWYENQGQPTAPTFDTHLIDGSCGGAKGIYAADLDGDTNLDVIASCWSTDNVRWYRGSGSSGEFSGAIIIDNLVDGPYSISAADIDRE